VFKSYCKLTKSGSGAEAVAHQEYGISTSEENAKDFQMKVLRSKQAPFCEADFVAG
jgi:hypothetical protein